MEDFWSLDHRVKHLSSEDLKNLNAFFAGEGKESSAFAPESSRSSVRSRVPSSRASHGDSSSIISSSIISAQIVPASGRSSSSQSGALSSPASHGGSSSSSSSSSRNSTQIVPASGRSSSSRSGAPSSRASHGGSDSSSSSISRNSTQIAPTSGRSSSARSGAPSSRASHGGSSSSSTRNSIQINADHESKEWKCQQCGAQFTRSDNLSTHIREVHQTAAVHMHRCHYCSKGFPRKNTRDVHERIHTGVKPFACKLCHASFAQRQQVTKHMRSMHMCPRCNAEGVVDLEAHFSDVHPRWLLTRKSQNFRCVAGCNRTFPSVADLREHQSTCVAKIKANARGMRKPSSLPPTKPSY